MTAKLNIAPLLWSWALVTCLSKAAFAEVETKGDQLEHSLASAIWAAAIAGFFGGLGWIAAYLLNGLRDDRTKRLQLTIENTSTQIREFYAPLTALTEQLNTTVRVKETIVSGKDPQYERTLTAQIYKDFFLPIHEQINTILQTRIHLMEGFKPPQSFDDYFEHFSTEKAYWQLSQGGEDVSGMEVPPYPSSFYHDIRGGFETVMRRYDSSLRELQHPDILASMILRLRKGVASNSRV